MKKQPLSQEQVKEIVDFINSGKWGDFPEVIRYTGYEKLTYIDVAIDKLGLVTAKCKEHDIEDIKNRLPVYRHRLYTTDYTIVGEEEKGQPIKWMVKSDKYTMPKSKKLAKSLTDALEAHKESCDFDDFWESYSRRDYDAMRWTEAEAKKAIKEVLPRDKKYVFFDVYGECQELYCYDDLEDLLLSLMLDLEESHCYWRVGINQAVDILFHQLVGRKYRYYWD